MHPLSYLPLEAWKLRIKCFRFSCSSSSRRWPYIIPLQASPRGSSGQQSMASQGEKKQITLKVKDAVRIGDEDRFGCQIVKLCAAFAQTGGSVTFKVKTTTKFSKIINAYASKMGTEASECASCKHKHQFDLLEPLQLACAFFLREPAAATLIRQRVWA